MSKTTQGTKSGDGIPTQGIRPQDPIHSLLTDIPSHRPILSMLYLDQQFSMGAILSPQGLLAMSGDIYYCYNLRIW